MIDNASRTPNSVVPDQVQRADIEIYTSNGWIFSSSEQLEGTVLRSASRVRTNEARGRATLSS